ncbi:MAG: tetratricopeptide repeat protein, partial [Pseudomonadota bacterium]
LPREAMLEAARSQWLYLFPGIRRAAPPALLESLLGLAQGNPFYLEELFRFVRDRGIDPTNEDALARMDMPESLQTLILARIDQLSEHDKTILRVASVIGRLFNADWLPGFAPEMGSLERVKQALAVMESVDLTPLDSPEPELKYLFKHIITHEVAYESLPYELRQRLHERLGLWLEAVSGDHPPVDTLASHFGRTANRAKQLEYFRKAAEAARKSWANEAALAYYARLLTLLGGAERAEILLARAEVQDTVGDLTGAQAAYQEALELAEAASQPLLAAKAVYGVGVMKGLRGESTESQVWLQRATAGFAALGAGAQQAASLCDEGLFLARTGAFDAAEAKLKESLDRAQAVADQKTASSALNYLGSIAHARGRYAQARSLYADSLAIKRQLGDRHKIALTLNNLGVVATDEGLFDEALSLLQESLQLRRAMGEKSGIAATLVNLAAGACFLP